MKGEMLPGVELPEECPECGRECHGNRSFITHYSNAHERPYPWKERAPRGEDWPEQRNRALKRDEHECQNCGATEDLHVHHLDGSYRNNALENLQTLCASCHAHIHWKEDNS